MYEILNNQKLGERLKRLENNSSIVEAMKCNNKPLWSIKTEYKEI